MPFIFASIILQLACAVHCVRGGRNQMWLMVIILLSIPGCLAYAVFEVLPGYAGRREVRLAKSAALRKLDPERSLRAAREALDIADTAATRIALGDALADRNSYHEAAAEYERALAKAPQGDRATQIKLAEARLDGGEAVKARILLETVPESRSVGDNDRVAFLLARALEECGEKARALDLYADVARRLPGGEAQCRRAALLIAEGRRREALDALVEVERTAKRLDRFERAKAGEMYGWATRTLAELRAERT